MSGSGDGWGLKGVSLAMKKKEGAKGIEEKGKHVQGVLIFF